MTVTEQSMAGLLLVLGHLGNPDVACDDVKSVSSSKLLTKPASDHETQCNNDRGHGIQGESKFGRTVC